MSFMKTLLFSLIALCLTSATQAARFDIINDCQYTVWPAAVPQCGGRQLKTGETWSIDVPAGTQSARIWGRTGCSFNSSGHGRCQTGDCDGVIGCQLSGQSPLTLAEFSLNGESNLDYYDISVIDGFNIPMELSPTSNNGCTHRLLCTSSSCPDAYHQPNDVKTFTCPGGTNFKVVFCPNALTFEQGDMHFVCSSCNTL